MNIEHVEVHLTDHIEHVEVHLTDHSAKVIKSYKHW
jgi:hypothetical protein